jgi:hypothetical protein
MEPVDIYYNFRKAQSESKGRGFRMPKDFGAHLEKKFSKKNREALMLATQYFNTKWTNVNVYRYMQCGFEMFKTFSYIKFFDPRIMRLYVQKDKNIKREMNVNKKAIIESVKFIKRFMKENNIHMLRDYLQMTNGHRKIIVDHYVHGSIDKYLLVWLVKSGRLILTDDDRACMTYIVHQYREIGEKLQEINGFMRKVGEKL